MVGSVTSSARSAATGAEGVSWPSEGGQSRSTSRYGGLSVIVSSWDSARSRRRRPVRLGSGRFCSSVCSPPTSTSRLAPHALGAIASLSTERFGSASTSATVHFVVSGSRVAVQLPCGSRSTTNVRMFRTTAAPAKPSTREVLPTPPFRLSTATVRTSAAYGARISAVVALPLSLPPSSLLSRPFTVLRMRACAVHRALEAEVAAARLRLGAAPRVLDVGGGSGVWAVPLARSGCRVPGVARSPSARAARHRRATEAGGQESVGRLRGAADSLSEGVPAGHADLVLGHGVLEVVEDPAATMQALADATAPGGAVSVLVANRYAAVLVRALAGRLAEARRVLDDPHGQLGTPGPVLRRFD